MPTGIVAVDVDRNRSTDITTADLFGGGVSVLLNQIAGPPICGGDCDEGGSVSIDELIRSVNVALGRLRVADCVAADDNADASVTINELILAVRHALGGCDQ